MSTKTKPQLLAEIKALQKRLAELQAVEAKPHLKNDIGNKQSLRESEDQYRSVVEGSPGVINRFLPDGTITFVNHEYGRFFRRKYDELIGMDSQETGATGSLLLYG